MKNKIFILLEKVLSLSTDCCFSSSYFIDYNFWCYWRLFCRTLHQGANITKLTDAFLVGYSYNRHCWIWWLFSGYGSRTINSYTHNVTGIDIFVLLVRTLAQRRLQRVKSRLKSKTELEPSLSTLEIKIRIN